MPASSVAICEASCDLVSTGCKVTPFRKTGGAPFMVTEILDKIKEEWAKMETEK